MTDSDIYPFASSFKSESFSEWRRVPRGGSGFGDWVILGFANAPRSVLADQPLCHPPMFLPLPVAENGMAGADAGVSGWSLSPTCRDQLLGLPPLPLPIHPPCHRRSSGDSTDLDILLLFREMVNRKLNAEGNGWICFRYDEEIQGDPLITIQSDVEPAYLRCHCKAAKGILPSNCMQEAYHNRIPLSIICAVGSYLYFVCSCLVQGIDSKM